MKGSVILSYKVLIPDYYEKFECIGGACKDSCCYKWNISFDKNDYMKLRKHKDDCEFKEIYNKTVKRNRKNGSDTSYASMQYGENGGCGFLTEEGLCSVQLRYGAKTLPYVCQTYPRKVVYVEDIQFGQYSACMGCEGVLSLLWDKKDGLKLITRTDDKKDPIGLTAKLDRESPLLSNYEEIQRSCIKILQNRSYALGDRIILLGMAMKKLEPLQKDDQSSPELLQDWLGQAKQMAQGDSFAASLNKLPVESKFSYANNISLISQLPDMQLLNTILKEVKDMDVDPEGMTIEMDMQEYQQRKEKFEEIEEIQIFLENLMVNTFLYNNPLLLDVWDAYLFYCSYYSVLKQCLLLTWDPEQTKENLFHTVVICSRLFLHSSKIRPFMIDLLKSNGSNTLGHMAILAKG